MGDVTGDGAEDLVVGTKDADVQAADVGAIYVWHGAAALVGSPPPLATLTVPGASASDGLGFVDEEGQAIQLADVTADGTLDVIAAATRADVGGIVDAGAVYVWRGGPTLVGNASLAATLTVAGATASDLLASGRGQGVVLGDVTGDEKLDLVVGTRYADVRGIADAGAVYVWAGGIAGTPPPTATLTVPIPNDGDELTHGSGIGVQLADVDGDGTLDVVTGGFGIDLGASRNAGAVFVWSGGSGLVGSPAPSATLAIPGFPPTPNSGAGAARASRSPT